jgi:hypothetical protein
MKSSLSTSLDRVRENGIMKKRNHSENTGRERPIRCVL